MKQEDFVSIMQEIVPRLIDESMTSSTSSSSSSSHKRPAENASPSDQPETSKIRTQSPNTEALSVQPSVHETLSAEWLESHDSIETLIAAYLQHKAKEIPHSNNPPDLQKKVDQGKRAEWETMTNRPDIVKIHYGKAATKIKESLSHRFIGSRFVITRKATEEGVNVDPTKPDTFTCKARWCLQGHLDPDLSAKAEEGKWQSPTLNQLSRMVLMQIIASHGWDLQLGDIKSAFLEAGQLEERWRPLYANQPPGGIPGLPPDAVIEVLGNIYGQNDAPASWFSTFKSAAAHIGWTASSFDQCLFTLRSKTDDSLIGIMGVHVDDTALGGSGPEFEAAVAALKARFPYRKWRVNDGEFCGCYYRQCKSTKKITMSMEQFVDKLKPAHIPKGTPAQQTLNPYQIKQLRGINGSLNWLSTQGRPDLAAQTSLSQQAFPNPKISHLRHANNVVRRARMHRDLKITFEPIAPDKLTLVCHSDAAFANVGQHTQAGHIIAFCSKELQDGHLVQWVPATWRSHKLSRAVSSTLAAESQSMSVASGTVEWLLLVLTEVLDGKFPMRECRDVMSRRPPILVTDCKSLYDHLLSPSAPTAIEDRRTSIDVTIIRESIHNMSAHVRWVPTNRMLADGLTKDQGDPLDLPRSCIKAASYQISPEDTVLQMQAEERENRMNSKLQQVEDSSNSLEGDEK